MLMTKDEVLKYIKSVTNWTDVQCLNFYEQEERMQSELQDTCPVYYAYYIMNDYTGHRRYGVSNEESFEKIKPKVYNYVKYHSKNKAEKQIESWKEDNRY